ncbi:MAG: hypothetical protein KKH98_14235 [Spirochaetes bacterium]|nr:hypothetical protein [Spirochaetota bacterium]
MSKAINPLMKDPETKRAMIESDIRFRDYFHIKKFELGWKLNNMSGGGVGEWRNVHLGNDPDDKTDNLTHSLNAHLRELSVKVFISTDGTDENSFEVIGVAWRVDTGTIYGTMPFEVDVNNIIIQTGAGGINYISTTGGLVSLSTEAYYYNIVIYHITK